MKMSKEFMLLFRFEPDFTYQPSSEDLVKEQQQWGNFIGNLAMQEKLVSTYQLGFEGKQVTTNQEVTNGIYRCGNETLAGNLVVIAQSLDEVVEISKSCPILSMGGSVEIREIIPMN